MDATMMIVVVVVMVVVFALHKIAVWRAPAERISPQRHTCENKKSDDTIEDEKKTPTEDDDDQLPSYSEACHGYQA